jgi:hypothetical protein
MQQAAKWRIHFSLAVNSARGVDPKNSIVKIFGQILHFSSILESGCRITKPRHTFLSFPFEINFLFMMPQSTSAQLHQKRRLEVGIHVVKMNAELCPGSSEQSDFRFICI